MEHLQVRRVRAMVALLALSFSAVGAAAPLLTLGRGEATLTRGGQPHPAQAQEGLEAGDTVSAPAGGGADLSLSHYGELALGPAAAVAVKRLPFSTYAEDLSTEFQLDAGTVHLVWKYPALSAPWPLVIAVGGVRATFASGEYFIAAGDAPTLCVRSGQAAVEVGGQLLPAMLKPPACYRFDGTAPPTAMLRSDLDFIAMRETRSVDAKALHKPQAVAPTPTSRAARPAVHPPVAASAAGPAASASAPADPRGWIVVAASLETLVEAQRELARMKAAGYSAALEEAHVKGRNWYRVQVGGMRGLPAARALVAELKTRLGYTDAWLRPET